MTKGDTMSGIEVQYHENETPEFVQSKRSKEFVVDLWNKGHLPIHCEAKDAKQTKDVYYSLK